MRGLITSIAAFIILAMPIALAEQKPERATLDPLARIQRDYDDGRLTVDEKVRLQLTAIESPNDLPVMYRPSDALTTRQAGLRSVTPTLLDIQAAWDRLSEATQQAALAFLARPTATYEYNSASGFFKLHYDLSGVDAVPTADEDMSGVPDFVEKCASYCDSALARHSVLGYFLPPSDGTLGGDSAYDVYFKDMDYYGYTVAEGFGPEPWNDKYSYLVLNNNFLGFPSNYDPEGPVAGAAKVTVAHEFHHAVQFAYDYTEALWFMELDATYMEDICFDLVDDNYNYLSDFMDYPQTSLMENSYHAYSCFVYGVYLAEQFDTSLMVAVWEGARYKTTYNALSDTLLGRYGWTQDSAFAEFVTWNFCTSSRDDGGHYVEGAAYLPVAISREHSTYPVNTQNIPTGVASYASSYVTFYPPSTQGDLTLTFNGDELRDWAAYIIKSTGINEHEFEKLELDPETFYGVIEVPDFQDYYSVTLVGINTSELSTEAPLFAYSAVVVPPYDVSSRLLTADSVIYSGGTRQFSYQVNNTSPLNDIFDVFFRDDLGWITPDTIDRAIAAGDSAVFTATVHPPQGTPIGTISNLFFKAQSWGDATVVDSQKVTGLAVLQRGDLDFSGFIDIADIVYFVQWAFSQGPAPVPTVEAANFDCVGTVDIADLMTMVEYAFNNGPASPCNPY